MRKAQSHLFGNQPFHHGGFTIIQRLIAVLITCILTAIVFAFLAPVQERSRRRDCVSNLRQIGAALRLYQADYDNQFPNESFKDSVRYPLWSDPLHSYIKTTAIYHCPDGDSGLTSDYRYRISNLAGAGPKKIMLPEAANVIVYCSSHVFREFSHTASGVYLVLKNNGSVQEVPASNAAIWEYKGGKWSLNNGELGASVWPVFPDEPWPPKFR